MLSYHVQIAKLFIFVCLKLLNQVAFSNIILTSLGNLFALLRQYGDDYVLFLLDIDTGNYTIWTWYVSSKWNIPWHKPFFAHVHFKTNWTNNDPMLIIILVEMLV